MNANLENEFIVDKQNNTLTTRREFAAAKKLVWDCHTKSELLDQWYAPKSFTTETKHMDFRVGGYWHFAMIDPQGQKYWNRADYLNIEPIDSFTYSDGFSDETGALNPAMPNSKVSMSFFDKAENTVVQSVVNYASLADLEKVIEMGVQEGIKSTQDRLVELLAKLS